jgi:hypothetical protein
MRLDKECEDERIAKIYKETNKEREEGRASVQHQKDEKLKNAVVIIFQKYIYSQVQMVRRAF